MKGSKTDEAIEELSESLLQIYQKELEESMRGNDFIFDNIDILYYNLNKISLVWGGLFIYEKLKSNNKSWKQRRQNVFHML